MTGATTDITIDSSTFYNTTAAGDGGVFYSSVNTASSTINIQSSDFHRIQSLNMGSFIRVEGDNSAAISMTVQDSVFDCKNTSLWSSWPTTYNAVITSLDAVSYNIGSLFSFEDGS
jgi:hypothetical protein